MLVIEFIIYKNLNLFSDIYHSKTLRYTQAFTVAAVVVVSFSFKNYYDFFKL